MYEPLLSRFSSVEEDCELFLQAGYLVFPNFPFIEKLNKTCIASICILFLQSECPGFTVTPSVRCTQCFILCTVNSQYLCFSNLNFHPGGGNVLVTDRTRWP